MSNVRSSLHTAVVMKETNASLAALVVTPAIPAMAFALTSPGLGGGADASMRTLIGLSLVFYPYALAAAVILGFPMFLLLRSRGRVGPLWSTAAGALIGSLVSLILLLPVSAPIAGWLYGVAGVLPFMCSTGALTGLFFWVVRRTLCGASSQEARDEA